MKILNVYRSEPDETVKKLVEIVTRDRESERLNWGSRDTLFRFDNASSCTSVKVAPVA